MKAKDWQKAAQLVQEWQIQASMADTSELSSISLSELPVDQSGPPTVIQGPYVPYQQAHPFVCHKRMNIQQLYRNVSRLFTCISTTLTS